MTRPSRKRLGEVLVAANVLTAEQLQSALDRQAQVAEGGTRLRLGEVITQLGLATEAEIATSLASQLNLEMVDLRFTTIPADLARLVPRQVATRAGVVVLERIPNGLKVATSDPTNVVGLDDVRMYTHARELVVCVAQESQIREVHARTWSLADEAGEAASVLDGMDADAEEELGQATATDDAPTVRVVNMILSDAVRAGASDIHVEPMRDALRVRFRVDGLLRDVMTAPRSAAASVISRLKVTSGLDIAERRVPQDGRTRITVEGSTVDARVSTLPNLHGEKVVIRLLARAEQVPEVEELGMLGPQLATMRRALQGSQGLVLITGPTGSGKTNTLYAALAEVHTVERNIITLEDPVEIQMNGITQVQVHERSGMTFARGLRAVLRQDPDIVLVGEVRDTETAELALQASLTGHLVLSTLHTNDAVSAVTRMVEMGVEPYLVGSSLALVVAQRLVRRPCSGCAAPGAPDPDVLARLGLDPENVPASAPRAGTGCAGCGNTGYRGRLGLFEVLAITPEMRRVLLESPTETAVATEAATQGMMTLREAGLQAVNAGTTTYEEVLRATPTDRI
ncbi:MAG: GspE/PulE family protein [Actinomycetes bacterium]